MVAPLLLWAAGAVGAAVVTWAVKEWLDEDPPSPSPQPRPVPPRRPLHFKGELTEDCILVIGRTGSGKSSLINMLKGNDVLPTGIVGSTTRWLEGVPVDVDSRTVTFIDSPGIGEAGTDSDYRTGIKDWYSHNRNKVRGVLLVLQADSKAHADDAKFVMSLRSTFLKPTIIILNQADKIKPVRDEFRCQDWRKEQNRGSTKNQHIKEKIEEVTQQFRQVCESDQIVPLVAEARSEFNRKGLVQALQTLF